MKPLKLHYSMTLDDISAKQQVSKVWVRVMISVPSFNKGFHRPTRCGGSGSGDDFAAVPNYMAVYDTTHTAAVPIRSIAAFAAFYLGNAASTVFTAHRHMFLYFDSVVTLEVSPLELYGNQRLYGFRIRFNTF
nr:unnamed protein product [Callosobruchus chinensis]